MNIFYFSDIPQYSYQKYHKTSNVFKEKNETYSHLYIYKQQIFIYFFNFQTHPNTHAKYKQTYTQVFKIKYLSKNAYFSTSTPPTP